MVQSNLLPSVDDTYFTEWSIDARLLAGTPTDEVAPAERAVRDLAGRLAKRRQDIDEPIKFARSEHPLPKIPGQTDAVYRRFAELCRRPWGRLIVEALSERIEVIAIDTASGFDFGDVWRRDNLDQAQTGQWLAAAETGATAWMVYPDDGGDVRISVESGMQVQVAYDAWGDPTEAVKVSPDGDDGALRVDYWDTNVHRVWRWAGDDGWTLRSSGTNPVGAVPVVEAKWRRGLPELHDLTSPLASIERMAMEGHVAAHVAAYPQRWASGIERYVRDGNDEIVLGPDGDPIELPTPWQGAIDSVFTADSPDAKFGAFDAVDLRMYIAHIESDVAQLGTLSRVPANYLSIQGTNLPNADSLAAAHDPFIHKVTAIEHGLGRAIERLANTYAKAVGADAGQVEVHWAPLVSMSESARADSVLKWSQVSDAAPMTWVLRRAGVPEEAIVEFEQSRTREDLLAPGPVLDPAVQLAVQMVSNQPTIVATGDLTVSDLVAQLRAAGVE